MSHGFFLAVEGPEGAGKSTLVSGLAARLRQEGTEPLVVREPGGTETAEAIRRILLEPESKLAVFSTVPAIRSSGPNLGSEIIGGFALVLALLAVLSPGNFVPGSDLAKGFGPVLVGVIVMAIGLSLGGPTGYAINPARDLGPRIAHAVLPIAGKGGSDWGYAWIPIVGPTVGGVLGALCYQLMWKS